MVAEKGSDRPAQPRIEPNLRGRNRSARLSAGLPSLPADAGFRGKMPPDSGELLWRAENAFAGVQGLIDFRKRRHVRGSM